MSLTLQTSKAVGWTTLARIIQQAFQFGLSMVLMRLLGPEAFGLIAMVLVFSGFAGIFQELGFSSAIVQHQDLREEHRSTAFWLTIGMGVLLGLLMALVAPLIALFYHEPLLKPLSLCLALTFLLNTPGMVPRALLQKGMRFDVLAKTDVVAALVSGVLAVTFAAKGAGVWSLVIQQLVAAGITSVSLFISVNWRPRFIWSREAFRDFLGFGSGLTGFNIVNYWARSADKLLIGKFMDATALGLYSRAYSLMLLPLSQIISVVAPVMFPALSSIQGDKARVRNAYLRAISLLTFMAFPVMVGLAAVAKPFVLALFGEQWAPAIPLIQILSFVGLTQTLCNPTGWIYMSQGRTDLLFWWGGGGSAFLVAAIIVGLIFGDVETVALAYLVGNIIETLPCVAVPGRLIGMSLRDVWLRIYVNLFCSVFMGVIVWTANRFLPDNLEPLYQLGILVAVGIGTYVLVTGIFAGAVYRDIVNIVGQIRRVRTVTT